MIDNAPNQSAKKLENICAQITTLLGVGGVAVIKATSDNRESTNLVESSFQEVETRAVIKKEDVDGIVAKLRSEGFELDKTVLIHDMVFDRSDARLFRNGYILRLRIENDNRTITYKDVSLGSKQVSRRNEFNVPVDEFSEEAIIGLFEGLGYPMLFQTKRERIVYIKIRTARKSVSKSCQSLVAWSS